jgi:hypothetical protein
MTEVYNLKGIADRGYDLTWFDNGGISIGIDWQSNKIVVADTEHPDGATIEVGTFSDLEVFYQEDLTNN